MKISSRILLIAVLILGGITSSGEEPRWAQAIAKVKALSASSLDPAAPDTPLEIWLNQTLGPDANFEWTPSDCDLKPDPPEPAEGYPVCVMVRAWRTDGIGLKLHILVGPTRMGLVSSPEYQPQSFMVRPRYRCPRDDQVLR